MKTFSTYNNEQVNEEWEWETSTLKKWLDKLGEWLEKLFGFDDTSISSTPMSTSVDSFLNDFGCVKTRNANNDDDDELTYSKEDIQEARAFASNLFKGGALVPLTDDEEKLYGDDSNLYDVAFVKYDSTKIRHKELSFPEINKMKAAAKLKFQKKAWERNDDMVKNITKIYKQYHIHNMFFYDAALNFWGSCWYSVENNENNEIPAEYKNYLFIYGGYAKGYRASNWMDDDDGDMFLKQWLDIVINEGKKINKSIEGVVMSVGKVNQNQTHIYGYEFKRKGKFYIHTF